MGSLAKCQTEVLLVDDDPMARRAIERVLIAAGFKVHAVADGEEAIALYREGRLFHVVVTDLVMRGIGGMELLRLIRQVDVDVPVIIVTGSATLETALQTLEYGGFRYLLKPVEEARLLAVVKEAAATHRLQLLKRQALHVYEAGGGLVEDQQRLDESLTRALDSLWIAYQPIVSWPEQRVFGYEGLLRSLGPELVAPGAILDAAERLGRTHELGRRIRLAVSKSIPAAPDDCLIFMNVHARDLSSNDLFEAEAPLSRHAHRVVLEITERTSLEHVDGLRDRIARLRRLGYRIAVDDLGAGYSGLSSFSQLEPDLVKLDMSLVRDIDSSPAKSSLVRSMLSVCKHELNMRVVCEGVETVAERDTLERLGADLLQGYLFAKPERAFRSSSIFPPARSAG